MTPTSDERREVARRLRTEVSEGECIDYAVFRIVHDVMGVEDAMGARAGRILADLIDPTCHVRGMAEYIVDTTDGILHSRTTGELVRCGECIHFGRCPMRKGDGSGYCWQAKRREERHGE